MKIAVVGTGISGLTAGWYLGRSGHQVTLIERMPRLGLDAHAVEFELGSRQLKADLPPRYFSESAWPHLYSLYEEIGAEIQPVDRSKSWGQHGSRSLLRVSHRRPRSPGFRSLLSWKARRIRHELWRFESTTREELNYGSIGDIDFETYLNSKNYSDDFVYRFLYPSLSSTVCTCSYKSLSRYPAGMMVEMVLHLLLDDRLSRVKHGVADAAERLSQVADEIRLKTEVQNAESGKDGLRLRLSTGEILQTDHLVIATQANTATQLLPRMTEDERQALTSFDYEDSTVILHHDSSVMPARRGDWSHFNTVYQPDLSDAMCTVWMNRFYSGWNRLPPVFQTIRPFVKIDESKTICRRNLQRPVINEKALQGLNQLNRLHRQPDRRIWFCGAYASPGVPLLESGVLSGKTVAQLISNQLPGTDGF